MGAFSNLCPGLAMTKANQVNTEDSGFSFQFPTWLCFCIHVGEVTQEGWSY